MATIPMHIDIGDAFVGSCTIYAGDAESSGDVLPTAPTFKLEFDGPVVAPLILKSPNPITPYDRKGTLDAGPLGLATPSRTANP